MILTTPTRAGGYPLSAQEPRPSRAAVRLLRHYAGTRVGVHVVRRTPGSEYETIEGELEQSVIDTFAEFYAGGYQHEVSAEIGALLIAAGFQVDGANPPPVPGAPATGVIAWTEADDVWAATGRMVIGNTGTIAWTEADDTCVAAGSSSMSAATGNIAWTEGNDTCAAAGHTGNGQFVVFGKDIINPTGHRIRPVGANGAVFQTSNPYVSNMPAAVGGVRVTLTGRVADVQGWGWNAVRVTVVAEGTPGGYIAPATACSDLVTEYAAQGIIVMPECHDHTGADLPYNSASWAAVHSFWADLLALQGTNPYLWVNYSNEPIAMGSDTDPGNAIWLALWNDRYSRVRALSEHCVFVVDAPTYGQGIGDVIARAAGFLAGKTNVVFSWHNYGAYGDATAMAAAMAACDAAGIPVMIGECGYNPDGVSSATTTWANDKRGVDFAIGPWYASGKGFMWWHATGDSNATSGYSLRNNPPNNGTFIDTTLTLSTAGAAIWALRSDSHVLS